MKRYHVYGLGNALVDMEFETQDDELKSLGVDKGLMTLIEEERQAELVEKLWRKPIKRSCGGSAANTMIGISQLGGRTFYSCKIANDETGEFFLADLQKNGVDSNFKGVARPSGITGKCLVMVTPDAERTMNTYLGISASFGVDQLSESALKDSEYVYIEGYLVPSPSGKEAAIKARHIAQSNGVKVALTLSDPNMVKYFGPGLKEMMGHNVDLLFCNELEAEHLAGGGSFEDWTKKLKELSKNFVITMGAKGAFIYWDLKTYHIPATPTKAIDTNGAGDLFAGAFLYGITHGMGPEKSGVLANRCSARLIQEFGPRLEATVTRSILQAL